MLGFNVEIQSQMLDSQFSFNLHSAEKNEKCMPHLLNHELVAHHFPVVLQIRVLSRDVM